MTNAVSYAYADASENHPSLLDQFAACRAHARAQGYTVIGEFNEIDEADHPATGSALDAVRNAIANDAATVILVYQPTEALQQRLGGLGVAVESIALPRGSGTEGGGL